MFIERFLADNEGTQAYATCTWHVGCASTFNGSTTSVAFAVDYLVDISKEQPELIFGFDKAEDGEHFFIVVKGGEILLNDHYIYDGDRQDSKEYQDGLAAHFAKLLGC